MGRNNKPSKKKQQKKEKPWRPFAFLDSKANWFIVLLIGVSFLQSKATIDPNIAIRFIGFSLFLAAYLLYFFILKKNALMKAVSPISKWIFISLIGYIIWSSVGLYFATNPTETIYFLTKHVLEILLMYLAFHAAAEPDFDWIRLVKSMVWLGLIHAVIGIDQQFGIDFTSFSGTDKPIGTMANRNLFGSFLVMLLPFGLGYLFIKKSWNFLVLITVVLLLTMVYFSQTRSAWIAALIILGFFGLSIIQKSITPKKYFASLIVMGVLLVGALLSYNHFFLQNFKFDNQKIEDISSANTQKLESANERLVTWRETLLMTKEYPIMGVGLGNWKIEIPKYNQGGTRIEYGEITRIRPHNIYLHTLSETGIIGFILFYVPMLFIAFKSLIIISKSTGNSKHIIILIFFSVMIGVISDGLFSFPTERISHSSFLFVSMGFLLALITDPQLKYQNKYRVFVALPALLIAMWGVILGYKKYTFESHMNIARAYYLKNRPKEALQHVKDGTNKWVTLEINNDPIELVGAFVLRKEKKWSEALSFSNQSLIHNPHSSRILYIKGAILSDLKQYQKAIDTYQLALNYTPKHRSCIKNIALCYYFLGDYNKCLEYLEKLDFMEEETLLKLQKAATAQLKKAQEGRVEE